MAQSIFETSDLFKKALQRVQFRMDYASQTHVELFDKPWYEKYFSVGRAPHLDSEFKTILGKKHITIAASTLDGNSLEPIRMNQGYEELSQKMFYQAHAYKLTADEILKLKDTAEAILRSGNRDAYNEALNYITNELFDHTAEAVNGVKARLDAIILSALSNEGKHAITRDNDPQSPYVGKTMSFGLDQSHCALADVGHTWYDASTGVWNTTEQAACDLPYEIDAIMKPFRSYFKAQKILVDEMTALYICGMTKMKEYIYLPSYSGAPMAPVDLNMVNNWMKLHNLPVFEVVNREMNIQDGDQIKLYTPWRTGQLVFLPDANHIGTIETKFSDRERGIVSDGVQYANYGRIETRRMTYGERDGGEYYELLKAGVTAAPAIDTIDRILTFDSTKSSR